MRVLTAFTATAALSLGTASAAVIQVEDFNALGGHGATLDNISIATVTTQSNRSGSVNQALLFDTGETNTQDGDLEGPHQRLSTAQAIDLGNLVIIAENSNFSDPDDEARGGSVTFDFNSAVNLYSLDFADTRPGVSVEITDIFGATFLFTLFDDLDTGNNAPVNFMETLFFGNGVENAIRMVVNLPDSGAFDNLAYSEVPLPAGLLLMGTGAAVFLRKRKAA